MARNFPGADGNYFATSGSPARLNFISTNTPYSIAAWIRPDTTTSDGALVNKYNASNGPLFTVWTWPTIGLFDINSGGSGSLAVGGTLTTGAWHHVGGAWDGSNVQRVMQNGTQVGTQTMSARHTNANASDWRIGIRATGSQPFDGGIAHAAIWDVYLSDAEWMSLARGVSPLLVRRPVAYWPLLGSAAPEGEYSGGGPACQAALTGAVPSLDRDAPVAPAFVMAA